MGAVNKASADFALHVYKKSGFAKLLLPDKIIARTKMNGKIVWRCNAIFVCMFLGQGIKIRVRKDVIAAVNI